MDSTSHQQESDDIEWLSRPEDPQDAPRKRRLPLGRILLILLIGAPVATNEYIRRHRTLYILNATGQLVEVQVDNQPAVPISGLGSVTVAEGPHTIRVSGPVNETHNIALKSGYFERWSSQPAWVLNLGGEGVIEEVTSIYSFQNIPSQSKLVVGETFFHRPHVDYIFTEPPQALDIQLKRETDTVEKTSIGWVQTEDLNAFAETLETNRKAAIAFAEKRLRRNPGQPEFLRYFVRSRDTNERGQLEQYLASQLDHRPFDVEWHREYLRVAELNNNADLLALYERYLAADPSNAALQYLRGRVEPDWDREQKYYREAIASDAKLGWPWLALAVSANAEARWDDALKNVEKAKLLGAVDPDLIDEIVLEARMGKGEAKPLLDEYRFRTSAISYDYQAVRILIEVEAAAGRSDEINSTLAAWLNRLPPSDQAEFTPGLRAWDLYCSGKLDECVRHCNANVLAGRTLPHFHALLALGEMQEATDEAKFGALWTDPVSLLAISVAFGLEGKPEEAAHWRERAVSRWNELARSSGYAKMAKLLSASEHPSINDVYHVHLPVGSKALLFAALADRFPDERKAYLAEAARFNIGRKPPYHLVKKVLDKLFNSEK